MTRTLYADSHVGITIDDDAGIVRYARTQERYESIEAVRELHAKITEALSTLPRGKLALLVDVREAPARNDNPFEAEISRAIETAAAIFKRRAALVKSAVGKLQVKRLAKDRGDANFPIFSDESEAIAFLRGKTA
jgi:hypothetical protein